MEAQVNKSKRTNKDSINNDTAYKKGFDLDELTPKERQEYEQMIGLEYT